MKLLNIYGIELEVTSEFKDDIIFKQKNVVLYYLALFIKNGEVKLDFITEVIILFFLIM